MDVSHLIVGECEEEVRPLMGSQRDNAHTTVLRFKDINGNTRRLMTVKEWAHTPYSGEGGHTLWADDPNGFYKYDFTITPEEYNSYSGFSCYKSPATAEAETHPNFGTTYAGSFNKKGMETYEEKRKACDAKRMARRDERGASTWLQDHFITAIEEEVERVEEEDEDEVKRFLNYYKNSGAFLDFFYEFFHQIMDHGSYFSGIPELGKALLHKDLMETDGDGLRPIFNAFKTHVEGQEWFKCPTCD
jgi:hypothetical protein